MAIRGVSLDLDFSKEFTFDFTVQAHGSTMVKVMYINDPDSVNDCLAKLKQYLQEEKHKVAGLDLVPIRSSLDRDQWIAIAQVCMRDQALVYHYCRAMSPCGEFATFLRTDDCAFATVESRKNTRVLHNSNILCNKLIDIQELTGNGKEKDSMVDLAMALIHPLFSHMKEDVDTKDPKTWEVPLNPAYIAYVAKDGYACYEMYRRVLDQRACALPMTQEYEDIRSAMIKSNRNI